MTFDQKLGLAGLLASLLTPLALLAIGYHVNQRVKDYERHAEHQRGLSATRFELYKEIGFQLNDLYSYFLHVGVWKELSAADVIARKRALDRHIYTYRPIFSAELFALYGAFMAAAFKTYGAMGSDAQLRTSAEHRSEQGHAGAQAWFTGEDNREQIKRAYRDFIDRLALELGVDTPYRSNP